MSPRDERREEGSAPLVSVIIPCIDDTYLVEALEALASQQAAPLFEVLVVNGSRGGAGRVEDWEGRLRLQIVDEAGGGIAGELRNRGAAASRGSFLLFVDADDAVGRGYVRAMADALESHDLVCGGVDVSLLNPEVRAHTHRQERGLLTDMAFLPFAGAGTLGIRRSLFQDVGGFDPMLPQLRSGRSVLANPARRQRAARIRFGGQAAPSIGARQDPTVAEGRCFRSGPGIPV